MQLFVDIQKDFGSFQLKASFTMNEKIMGLLGPSGCGKSLTLKCIAGIIQPDRGKIVLNGVTLYDSEHKINLKPQNRRVGYLFQSYALFPNMSVKENVLCGLHSVKDRAERETMLRQLLSSMQLTDAAELFPHQLSGGQQQRTALARILASKPDLILLDEPFSALDHYMRDRLIFETKNLLSAYDGMSIMVTHNREEAYGICNAISLMENGKITAPRKTTELFDDPFSVAAAKMTGVRNIASCIKTAEHEIYVPSWGIHITTDQIVMDDIKAVAIREQGFLLTEGMNRYPVTFRNRLPGPYEHLVSFRYLDQAAGTEDLWWRCSKDNLPVTDYMELSIPPQKVYLLYE